MNASHLLPTISCVIDWPGTVSVIRDIVVTVGTIAAVLIIWRGFLRWRKTEQGKANSDLGRRLLTAAFKTRDWIKDARRPFILFGERPESYDTATLRQKRMAELRRYAARFKPVRDCSIELESLRCECEATWEEDIVGLISELMTCCRKLEHAMEMSVRVMGIPSLGLEQPDEAFAYIVVDNGAQLKADGTRSDENRFTAEVRAVVDKIETFVREKLRKEIAPRPSPEAPAK